MNYAYEIFITVCWILIALMEKSVIVWLATLTIIASLSERTVYRKELEETKK